jgi:hypothetical protein
MEPSVSYGLVEGGVCEDASHAACQVERDASGIDSCVCDLSGASTVI